MRGQLSFIVVVALILLTLVGLSATGRLAFDEKEESELAPLRSSYHAGPTGARAFYQLLAETGLPVARWRERFTDLKNQAGDSLLIVIGPFAFGQTLPANETLALRDWLAAGGSALIVSRAPLEQFPDPALPLAQAVESTQTSVPLLALLLDENALSRQPTAFTQGVGKLALAGAMRLQFQNGAPTPLVHLSDQAGALLAEFNYGAGRLVLLADPFLVANNGLAQADNLQLAHNLINTLGAGKHRILFDEYHHGYQNERHPLLSYFRGTAFWWVLGQMLLLGLLLAYSRGKRFARPLPLPSLDRHSPLEHVNSMASLQRAAEARDLAIENIYTRFKVRVGRRLGLSGKMTPEAIHCNRQLAWLDLANDELRRIVRRSERALNGTKMSDQQLVELVALMRRFLAQLK
jgi:hypothetical protein